MRLLDKDQAFLSLSDLGMAEKYANGLRALYRNQTEFCW